MQDFQKRSMLRFAKSMPTSCTTRRKSMTWLLSNIWKLLGSSTQVMLSKDSLKYLIFLIWLDTSKSWSRLLRSKDLPCRIWVQWATTTKTIQLCYWIVMSKWNKKIRYLSWLTSLKLSTKETPSSILILQLKFVANKKKHLTKPSSLLRKVRIGDFLYK